jgi:hypothetical protein
MTTRTSVVAAALSDLALGIIEATVGGSEWIKANIIYPATGSDKDDCSNTQYCGMTWARWLRLAGLTIPKGTYTSPGRLRNYLVKRDKLAVEVPVEDALPGDAVLHACSPIGLTERCWVCGRTGVSPWNGHVMMALAVTDTHILICEGNHGCSIGPSGKGYAPGRNGEDQTRRQGIGVRWMRKDDAYLTVAVRPNGLE